MFREYLITCTDGTVKVTGLSLYVVLTEHLMANPNDEVLSVVAL